MLELARAIGLELIEAPRALPVLDENDYRKVIYYVQHFQQAKNQLAAAAGYCSGCLGREADRRQVVIGDGDNIGGGVAEV